MRKRIALGLAIVLGVVVALSLRHFAKLARIGSGYAAEQTCACLFVSGRTLDSCRGDLDPLAQKLIRLDVGSDEVRASSAGTFAARAVYDARFGCTLTN